MPFRGKRASKSAYYRGGTYPRSTAATMIQRSWRRRRGARKSTVVAMLRGNRHNFHRAEWYANESITTDLQGFAGLAYEFRLDQITDYLNFNPLFDAFKISAVSVELIPVANQYAPGVPVLSLPQVACAVDFDDATAPIGVEKLLNRKNAKLRPFTSRISKYIRPKVSSLVYSAGVAQDYKQASQPNWIDLPDGVNVSHYGIKFVFQAEAGQEIRYHRRVKYYLTFKEPIVR